MSIKPIEYRDGVVRMIDQRLLPTQELWLEYRDYQAVAEAILTMVVRGAPAIGVAAAYGAALGARDIEADSFESFLAALKNVCDTLAATRPTAVNLFWALERMQAKARELAALPLDAIKAALMDEAQAIAAQDDAINRAMGRHGAELIADNARVLTHCNAGALATGGYGTALGVIRAAVESGKKISVLADETRPFLQGSRLTAWELHKDGIPVTLICDNMAGALMRQGEIDCVIVGADRIAANGDVANKIGTYSVAVLAKEHGLPFYVAAPLSTIDLKIPDGDHIPIEERDTSEVTHCGPTRLAPEGINVRNPAFDVTPAGLITAIITERGVVRGDYVRGLANLF
ncbi:S-methyl-5-thio-alpha-D-ribose-1-phosphate isomerase [Syntrophotalea carbinolica DSM 2380]|uniref:Methylthioribose-1-phosphate isomerase n=1 Tax=Syntrophotalea carbinolica (strain DSM 2380 / NBRC 103641 / GraBd1) TaxID=338963 RepID=MTNA_SYNC1|nr:S-methyl-5-thioribose-1-phosphate isomerase [Syntrophotalea carbinolica]Q3A2J8.1 RecName: Full=Methylthioribose-1-phosphate isomerase; Short=M1Pi; Short=MTR-1-P isomerase; AltName: Full=S-methyl-5-thioribose-1-phosphate isomerase [Syntrophotalea carbinolica DSM 2380]ABA89409.1 S-methyl-5-thio-alpha-D-ribose-1-phosphate isomerase [Syntrophotalea carbinolica DSM 2380]